MFRKKHLRLLWTDLKAGEDLSTVLLIILRKRAHLLFAQWFSGQSSRNKVSLSVFIHYFYCCFGVFGTTSRRWISPNCSYTLFKNKRIKKNSLCFDAMISKNEIHVDYSLEWHLSFILTHCPNIFRNSPMKLIHTLRIKSYHRWSKFDWFKILFGLSNIF